jgi:hypothetical protein
VGEFLFPFLYVIPYQENKTDQNKEIKKNIADRNFIINKKQAEINAEGKIDHQPKKAQEYRGGNGFEKRYYFRLHLAHANV